MERDPISMLQGAMRAAGRLPEKDWAALTADVDAEISTAVGFAENGTP
jgi:pyruvate dehydrogenase E1 component alpha subunit